MVSDKHEKNIIESFCRSSKIPVILLNSDMICKFSSDESILRAGGHFSSILAANAEFIPGETSKTMVKIKEKYYCALITPMGDGTYLCQLFDSENIFSMAQLSEVYDETMPMISANGIQIDFIESELKKLLLRESVKNDDVLDLKLLEITTESSRARGRFEELLLYYELSFSKNNNKSVINLYSYVKWAVDKCNSLLLNIGRCVELNCPDIDLPVYAESRYSIYGFIEMIQFALLYSPIDIEPIISLVKNNGVVEFMIICRGLIFVPKGNEPDFIGSRTGKLAIARRFAQRCGAEFRFINENNNIIGLKIDFPKIQSTKSNEFTFESAEIVDYNNTFSDFAEYKMQKVIDAWLYKNS